jgi:hypothetical protein
MKVEIKDVVSITGVPGLHRILKADAKGVIVESLDEKRKRQLVRGNMMVSKLADVSIYTSDDSEPLVKVFKAMRERYAAELPISKKSSDTDLMKFLGSVLPAYDPDRVFPFNVKKMVGWYQILAGYEVDFELPDPEAEEAGSEAAAEAAESTESEGDTVES